MNIDDKFYQLRKRAEETLGISKTPDTPDENVDLFRLLHEIDTYRIELELQNDELQNIFLIFDILGR